MFAQTATEASLPFILPAKLGTGVEYELTRWRFAVDVEYAFQSQNDRVNLEGTLDDFDAAVPNIFDWQDGVTLRTGVEYRLLDGPRRYPLRVGYVFDSTVSSDEYPSAFGTPPAPTHTVSLGGGVDFGGHRLQDSREGSGRRSRTLEAGAGGRLDMRPEPQLVTAASFRT